MRGRRYAFFLSSRVRHTHQETDQVDEPTRRMFAFIRRPVLHGRFAGACSRDLRIGPTSTNGPLHTMQTLPEVQLGTTKVDNFRYFAGKLRTLRKTTPFDEGSKLNKFQTERLCHWPTNRDLLVEGAQDIGHPSFLPLNSSKNGFRAPFAHVLLFTRSKSDRSNAENRSK